MQLAKKIVLLKKSGGGAVEVLITVYCSNVLITVYCINIIVLLFHMLMLFIVSTAPKRWAPELLTERYMDNGYQDVNTTVLKYILIQYHSFNSTTSTLF